MRVFITLGAVGLTGIGLGVWLARVFLVNPLLEALGRR